MRILLIEDDREMADSIALTLRANGHEVETSGDGRDGAARARGGDHAALIVDRMLPELDGLSLVKTLRADGLRTPILFLTTMSGIDDRVEGLEGGADDYVSKPFAAPELLARLGAITRRAERDGEAAILKAGELEMNRLKRSVSRAGRPVELQAQEFRLLEYLMCNAGRVVTRAMLLEHVWDLHFDPRTNIVETHMSRLRAKLDCGLGGEVIRTVRGTGYSLRAP
jgi:two-component system OmpR family response regulator